MNLRTWPGRAWLASDSPRSPSARFTSLLPKSGSFRGHAPSHLHACLNGGGPAVLRGEWLCVQPRHAGQRHAPLPTPLLHLLPHPLSDVHSFTCSLTTTPLTMFARAQPTSTLSISPQIDGPDSPALPPAVCRCRSPWRHQPRAGGRHRGRGLAVHWHGRAGPEHLVRRHVARRRLQGVEDHGRDGALPHTICLPSLRRLSGTAAAYCSTMVSASGRTVPRREFTRLSRRWDFPSIILHFLLHFPSI